MLNLCEDCFGEIACGSRFSTLWLKDGLWMKRNTRVEMHGKYSMSLPTVFNRCSTQSCCTFRFITHADLTPLTLIPLRVLCLSLSSRLSSCFVPCRKEEGGQFSCPIEHGAKRSTLNERTQSNKMPQKILREPSSLSSFLFSYYRYTLCGKKRKAGEKGGKTDCSQSNRNKWKSLNRCFFPIWHCISCMHLGNHNFPFLAFAHTHEGKA